jgi:ABC-type polysaccharide/polyol phosphate transport system ATPase subunit
MAFIQCGNLSLEYPLRDNSIPLKDILLRGLLRQTIAKKRKTVKALANVNVHIDEGERVGIIGNNGAGKSTLLRTFAGVYPPTAGHCRVDGEICSLFDINVGFEMDASGWKNIYYRSYLQGAMPREVRQRVQDIAAFTELGEFLDLPLRTYSSGMLIRLAFAIATAREPEILLIDEFFGAGDLLFQKKAEQRIKDLIRQAKIVIMVGHQLQYFRDNCQRVLWMEKGQVRADGPANEVIDAYEANIDAQRGEITAAAA